MEERGARAVGRDGGIDGCVATLGYVDERAGRGGEVRVVEG